MENNNVSADYMVNYGIANEFKKSLVDQIERVLMESDITLGVPIESRVKDLDSLMEKLERKEIDIEKVSDLDDLIGLRMILLFKRDLDLVTKCLKETFIILHEEDKLDVLEEDKFGYQSRHYIIKVPDEWLKLPTYSKFGEFKAEIQVRTLAQHIWAAASHKLQYKHEKSVPPQLRRAINRASAVLEVIDLEFERILIDRGSYIDSISSNENKEIHDEQLNVDNIKLIAERMLPPENKSGTENYERLLSELTLNNIRTTHQLIEVINSKLADILKEDKKRVNTKRKEIAKGVAVTDRDRIEAGVFYNHVGLIRVSAVAYFGKGYVRVPK